MWKLVIKQGYDDMEFRFKSLEYLAKFVEVVEKTIVPDKDGNTAVYTVTQEEKKGGQKHV